MVEKIIVQWRDSISGWGWQGFVWFLIVSAVFSLGSVFAFVAYWLWDERSSKRERIINGYGKYKVEDFFEWLRDFLGF